MVGCSRFLPLLGQNKGIAIFSRRGIILLSSRALYSTGNGSPHREGIYLSPPGDTRGKTHRISNGRTTAGGMKK